MELLLASIDKPLPAPVLTLSVGVTAENMPSVLRRSWETGAIDKNLAVKCTYDAADKTFVVRQIGKHSVIGRIFGTRLDSDPCDAFGSYARHINHGYVTALETGSPCYEHVLALMSLPDLIRRWVPYHRLVVPDRTGAVTVLTEIADVSLFPI